MINSKRKGKAGELEFCEILRAAGFAAERGVQYKGTPDSPDVICPLLPIHWEVKFGGRILLREAYLQASKECGPGWIPVVAYRSSRRGTDPQDLRKSQPWMVTLSASDFLSFIQKSEIVP